MRRMRARSGLAAVALAVLACDPAPGEGEGAVEQPTVTVWDSAGIEIVENHAPEHAMGEFWTIDSVPEFVLGGANTLGEPAHDSAQLVWDVVGLARLEDGRVAVLSSTGTQLLLFEPSGKLSRIIGRSGEGPGEFTRPEWLEYHPPDTLVVWDYFMTSIDRFDTAGTLLSEGRGNHARLRELGDLWRGLRLPNHGGILLRGHDGPGSRPRTHMERLLAKGVLDRSGGWRGAARFPGRIFRVAAPGVRDDRQYVFRPLLRVPLPFGSRGPSSFDLHPRA